MGVSNRPDSYDQCLESFSPEIALLLFCFSRPKDPLQPLECSLRFARIPSFSSWRRAPRCMIGLIEGAPVFAQSFASPMSYAVRSNPYDGALGDFNGDEKADLAVANNSTRSISVLLVTEKGRLWGQDGFRRWTTRLWSCDHRSEQRWKPRHRRRNLLQPYRGR